MDFKFLQKIMQGCYILMLVGNEFQILGPLTFNCFRLICVLTEGFKCIFYVNAIINIDVRPCAVTCLS